MVLEVIHYEVRPCWPLNLAALYAAAVTTAETLRVRLIRAVQGMVAWVPVWTRKSGLAALYIALLGT